MVVIINNDIILTAVQIQCIQFIIGHWIIQILIIVSYLIVNFTSRLLIKFQANDSFVRLTVGAMMVDNKFKISSSTKLKLRNTITSGNKPNKFI